jgi:AAA+ ATPase superfamily predicted ATPase
VVQNVCDHHLKQTRVFLVLAGSHVGMMTRLLHYLAPLYDRFTGHLHLKSLPFVATAEFLPRYTTAGRVAVYAILGGRWLLTTDPRVAHPPRDTAGD